MRPKLSYANVISTLCLFLLLTGVAAYAAGHLGKNTVGSKQLKKNAVSTAKIKKEAVTTAKLKKDAVTATRSRPVPLSGGDITFPLSAPCRALRLPTVSRASVRSRAEARRTRCRRFSARVSSMSLASAMKIATSIPLGSSSRIPAASIGIVNRGENGGYADSSDDEDAVFSIGDGIAFDYLDAGDADRRSCRTATRYLRLAALSRSLAKTRTSAPVARSAAWSGSTRQRNRQLKEQQGPCRCRALCVDGRGFVSAPNPTLPKNKRSALLPE